MLYRFLLVTLLLTGFCSDNIYAQTDSTKTPKNSVYIEAGGKAELYSLNYERQIYKVNNVKGGLAAGGAYLKLFEAWYASLEHNLMFGSSMHNLEIGAGANYRYITDTSITADVFYINGRIGYRFQPEQKGVLMRLSYTPLFRPNGGFLNWVGLSFGYAF